MSKFSINTENLNTPIKTFGDASGKLKDYSSELESVSQNLDSSFSEVVPVVEALAKRTNDHSSEVQVLGITLSNASGEYKKYDQMITTRIKKTIDPGQFKTAAMRYDREKEEQPTDPYKNVKDEDLKKLKDKYHLTDEEYEFIKKNYPGLLLSLYATDRYSSADANKVLEQIKEKLATRDNPEEDGVYVSESDRANLAKEAADIANSGEYEYTSGGDGTDVDNTGVKDFDCSGFVQYMYKKYGVNLPHNANDMWTDKADVLDEITEDQLQPGDLVFVRKGGKMTHVMIYVGDGKCAEAASESTGMIVRDMHQGNPDWRPEPLYYARVKKPQ